MVAAYLLAKQGHQVTIVEAASVPGGLLSTFDVGNGTRLEYFYHHFFTHDSEIHWLLEQLGLAKEVLYEPTTMGMYRDGRIHDFNGIGDLLKFKAIPLSARLRFAASSAMLVYGPGYAEAEETPSLEWFRRWAGKSATEAIWRPMLEIKFGQAAERIPLAWMAGRLRQRARSRSGMQERLGYLRGSLQRLVDHLYQALRELGVDVKLQTRIEGLQWDSQHRVTGVQTSAGLIEGDVVLSTVPTPILAPWLVERHPQYAEKLQKIRYMGAVCTILSLKEKLSPVYWLNVADPGFDFGGVIEQTNLIPASEYGGQHLVYLSRYLEWNHPLWQGSDEALFDLQLEQLSRLFQQDIRQQLVKHWVFRGKYAAPVAEIGFRDLIPEFRSPVPNLFIAAMPHVYPDERSVNNSIRVAAEVVQEMGCDTQFVPRSISLAAKYGRHS